MNSERDKIVINLLRIGAYLLREGNRVASKFGLNQQQIVVLNYISRNRAINQNKICSALVFEKSNLSKIIKKLVALELVTQVVDSVDRRNSLLSCTDKAEEILQETQSEFNRFNRSFLNEIADEDVSQILLSTDLITHSLKKT